MRKTFNQTKTFCWQFAICCAVLMLFLGVASATENGASSYPVGVETVLTGMYPHPGQTMFYEYTSVYEANETDDSNGHKEPIDFRLRVFATAIKISHTWGYKILGGNWNTNIAVPILYEELRTPGGKSSKYAIQNVQLVPFGVVYHTGIAHWYYEGDLFLPGTAYSKADALNIGQHDFSGGPVFGITLLPNKGRTEITDRTSYFFNGYDKDTHYHSGQEFFTEFNVAESVSKKMAIGFNGAFYKQTTDDHQFGQVVNEDGYRGRDLQVGPQVRFNLPHGGFAFKYYRDTLVENKTRGNSFWFQIAVPFPGLSASPKM